MPDTIVLGAGMVGVATALALQSRGREVLLIDRNEPGRETSYGNAGLIQAEAVLPAAIPLTLPRLARIAAGRSREVIWSLRASPEWLRPVALYARHSMPDRYAELVPHYARLIGRATTDHAELIAASGAEDIIFRTGFIQAYRDARSFAVALATAELARSAYGVPFTDLDGQALASAEPALRQAMSGAVHWTGTWSCRDPGGLVTRYAALFEKRGGTTVKADVRHVVPSGSGWRAKGPGAGIEAEDIVVALGPWSPALLKPLGYRVPMVFKRGYHQHFESTVPPTRPFMDVANATVISPMLQGVRVLTGAELNTISARANPRQLKHSVEAARDLFELGQPAEPSPWLGVRPCMPEMLPVIGRASRHNGLWFNFGHGHQGFTLGPTSGALLADVMAGQAPAESLRPYERY